MHKCLKYKLYTKYEAKISNIL